MGNTKAFLSEMYGRIAERQSKLISRRLVPRTHILGSLGFSMAALRTFTDSVNCRPPVVRMSCAAPFVDHGCYFSSCQAGFPVRQP